MPQARRWGDEGTVCVFLDDGTGKMVPASTAAPLPTLPMMSVQANPGNVVAGQIKIAVTGTAVQLSAASVPLMNGVSLRALDSNSASRATVGGANVNNAKDGTGNGAILAPGEGLSLGVNNLNALWVNGTAGDIFSYWGN